MMTRLAPLFARCRNLALKMRLMVPLTLLVLLAFSLLLRALFARHVGSASVSVPDLPPLSSVFSPEVRYWSPLIYAWATAYNIDPNLIATVIQIESCGDSEAISRSGAQGLFQVMPFHFRAGEDMQEVLTNGQRGMEYLAKSLQTANGDPGLALAGYNGGIGVIKRGWAGWADETRRYYKWGTGIYQDATLGHDTSKTLQDWLNAGGKSLCKTAAKRQSSAAN
jgi:soluble lytic murein transglycosylase-like protein